MMFTAPPHIELKDLDSLDSPPKRGTTPTCFHVSGLWDPNFGWQLESAVVIAESNIIDVGPSARIFQLYPGALHFKAHDYFLTPGMINSHTHAAMNFLRGMTFLADSMIENIFFKTESALTSELVERLCYGFLAESLLSGVTCLLDHYYFSSSVAKAVEKFGMRAWLGETIADRKGPFVGGTQGRFSWPEARNQIENWSYSPRVMPVVCPHAMDTVSPQLLTDMASFAQQNNIPLHMHLDQTSLENQRIWSEFGCSPVELARRSGALTPQTFAVHLLGASLQDLKTLSQEGSLAVLAPISETLYESSPNMSQFFESGVKIAYGTDTAASNDSANLLAEIKFAALLAKSQGALRPRFSPEVFWQGITALPALALGRAGKLGCLSKGAFADLVFWRKSVRNEPMLNPLVNMLLAFDTQDVQHVMIDANWKVWNGSLVEFDLKQVLKSYLDACEALFSKTKLKS